MPNFSCVVLRLEHGYNLRRFGVTKRILGLNKIYFVLFAKIQKNTNKKTALGTQHSWVSFKTFWSN